MQLPIQIKFRDMEPSEAVEARIRERSTRLERFYDHIMSCRVVVESPHSHQHKGRLYQVRIDVTVPDGELVVNHGRHHKDHSHEDVYVAIRDAFDAMRRRLEDYVQKRRGKTKKHEPPPHGRVLSLASEADYGRIQTPDDRVIYFHRNSVLNGVFDQLDIGSEVRFVEEMGDRGPQASSVTLVGKHHIVE